MSITVNYIGHSCFELVSPEVKILVDAFLAPNNPAATKTAADFSPDVVALTHGHVDHCADAQAVAANGSTELVALVEVANWFGGKGFSKVNDLNFGGTVSYPWGSIRMTQAVHTNTLPDGTVVGPAGGLVITIGDKVIYHVGDTALFSDLSLVKRRAPIDLALVPIGGWYTMDPEDAAEAVRLIGAKTVIPCHYNTFPPIEQDPQVFAGLVTAQTDSTPVILAPDESLVI